MVVTVSRRSSVDWLRLSLHFDGVRPADSELERGGLDRRIAGDVESVVGGVSERFWGKSIEPLEDAPFGSPLCSQDKEAYASSGIVFREELDRESKARSKISYWSLLDGKKIPALAKLLNRDSL